jgi:hypothetical protein
MLARRNDNAELCACIDIDVRIDAPLADEFKLIKLMEQRRPDLGSLAYQHQHVRIPQTSGERVDSLNVIRRDLDLMARQLLKQSSVRRVS